MSSGKAATFSASTRPHRVDVAHCVGSGNCAVVVRVVHEWREEVHGHHGGLLVVQAVDGSVVRRREADERSGCPADICDERWRRTCARASAPALPAQPAQEARAVSRTRSVAMGLLSGRCVAARGQYNVPVDIPESGGTRKTSK
jgi:hypothetical protein